MKRLLLTSTILLLTFLLTGCMGKNDPKDLDIKVTIPTGGPTFAFIDMIDQSQSIDNYQIDYDWVSGPDLLVSEMVSENSEIVIAPTNLGAKLYNQSGKYLFSGVVTFGNLYLVSQTDYELNELSGKTITVFGRGGTPDILLQKLLDNEGILDEVSFNYVESVDAAAGILSANQENIVLLAEPVISKLKLSKTIYTIMDLQQAYKEGTGTASYPQAGIYIHQSLIENHPKFVKKFLNKVELSTQFVNEHKEEAADRYIENDIEPAFPKPVIVSSIPNAHVGFKSAIDAKADMEAYLNLLLIFNENTIGGKLPDDDFYYQPTE